MAFCITACCSGLSERPCAAICCCAISMAFCIVAGSIPPAPLRDPIAAAAPFAPPALAAAASPAMFEPRQPMPASEPISSFFTEPKTAFCTISLPSASRESCAWAWAAPGPASAARSAPPAAHLERTMTASRVNFGRSLYDNGGSRRRSHERRTALQAARRKRDERSPAQGLRRDRGGAARRGARSVQRAAAQPGARRPRAEARRMGALPELDPRGAQGVRDPGHGALLERAVRMARAPRARHEGGAGSAARRRAGPGTASLGYERPGGGDPRFLQGAAREEVRERRELRSRRETFRRDRRSGPDRRDRLLHARLDDPQRRPRPHAGRRAGAAAAARMTSDRDAVTLTRDLLRFDTVNPPGQERACARHAGALLEAWGFRVDYHEYAEGRTSVVARAGGSDAKAPLCLTGHIDTVALGTAAWTRDPFSGETDGDRLYGRGSSDMKAGVAAILLAARKLAAKLPGTPGVVIVLTAAEEGGCIGSQHLARTQLLGRAGPSWSAS